jgi:hypothetical protein
MADFADRIVTADAGLELIPLFEIFDANNLPFIPTFRPLFENG